MNRHRYATLAIAVLVVAATALGAFAPSVHGSTLSTQSTSMSALRADNGDNNSDNGSEKGSDGTKEKRPPSLLSWVLAAGVGLVAAVGGAAAGGRFNRRRLKRHLDGQ